MTRKLGPLLDVFPIGLGCMGASHAYGGQEETEAIATIRRAVELGVTLFDTAEVYGPFTNEVLVGKALKPFRDDVAIATKFGFSVIETDKGPVQGPGLNGRPDNVRRVADASLQRLGVEIIDLYYLHRVDPDVPIEETVGAMGDLVRAGKVRAIGLSECGPQTLRRAYEEHPIAALQSEYSLWTRDPEDGVLETCRELGVGFVPFSPLGRGFLTGQITSAGQLSDDDFRKKLPRFEEDNIRRNLAAVEELKLFAKRKHASAAQVALAWVLAQGDFIVPIPGSRKIANLEQNVEAADLALSADDLAEIGEIVSPEAISGARYPEAMARQTRR